MEVMKRRQTVPPYFVIFIALIYVIGLAQGANTIYTESLLDLSGKNRFRLYDYKNICTYSIMF